MSLQHLALLASAALLSAQAPAPADSSTAPAPVTPAATAPATPAVTAPATPGSPGSPGSGLSLIHISEPTRHAQNSYAVF
ncbi:hypothetical protein D7W81_40805, partial [Corallococcus aberystwythensis]